MYHKKQYKAPRPPLSCHTVLYNLVHSPACFVILMFVFLCLAQLTLYQRSNHKWVLSKRKWEELRSLLIQDSDAQAQLSYAFFTFPKYFLYYVRSSLLSYAPILLHSRHGISCCSSFLVKLIEHKMPANPAPKGNISLADCCTS